MKKLRQQLASTLEAIHPQSYYKNNPSKTLTYPYLTYTIDTEELERNTEGGTLDIDIFGKGTSDGSVIDLEEKLKDALKYRRDLTPDLLLEYSFRTSLDIPTLVDDLHRRNVTFYVKITERNKQYGTT